MMPNQRSSSLEGFIPIGGKTIVLRLPASQMKFIANAVCDAAAIYAGDRVRNECGFLSDLITQTIVEQTGARIEQEAQQ